jgi:ribosomal RNA-processing protein 36
VGDFSADHFRKDYSFLSDVRQQELGTLKESLTRARKLLASSPVHLREERRLEVEVRLNLPFLFLIGY